MGKKDGTEKKKKSLFKRPLFWVVVLIVVAVVAVGAGSGGNDEGDDASTEEVEFEEIVVVDNDDITITVTDINANGLFGYTIDVTIVNKSEDVTYMVATTDYCAVDGVQTDPLFASEVAAGKTSYDTIIIYDTDDLEDAGVAFTDILLTFYAYDSDDWTADHVIDDVSVHIYPYGEDAATTFVRAAADTDLVLVDNDYVTVTVVGYDPDYLYGYAVELYIVNKTDGELLVGSDDESVNGIMCDPYWATTVEAGLSKYSTLYWFSTSLENIGIEDPETEITEIELTLRAYSYSYPYTYYVEDLVVTLYPQDTTE